MPFLLGQVVTQQIPDWAVGSITLGVLGLLGYVLRVTLPNIVKDFRDESASNRALFAEQVKAERESGEKARQELTTTLLELINRGDKS